jgi:hypothetical protein
MPGRIQRFFRTCANMPPVKNKEAEIRPPQKPGHRLVAECGSAAARLAEEIPNEGCCIALVLAGPQLNLLQSGGSEIQLRKAGTNLVRWALLQGPWLRSMTKD